VLFLLDKFAALRRLEPVERAMGLMAGYGIQLWPIL
jgi:type IV secretion system protein VirD4